MHKEYAWTQEEMLEVNLLRRKIPGYMRPSYYAFMILYAVLAVLTLFVLILAAGNLILSVAAIPPKLGLLPRLRYLALYRWWDLLQILFLLLLVTYDIYFLFFRWKRLTKKYVRESFSHTLIPRQVSLEGGVWREIDADGEISFNMTSAFIVYFFSCYIVAVRDETGKAGQKKLAWALPRRLFTREEEQAFRTQLSAICRVQDLNF